MITLKNPAILKTYLQNGDMILLSKSPHKSLCSSWTIERRIKTNQSSISYKARNNGTPGILKEFYPFDMPLNHKGYFFCFQRNRNGQLQPAGDAAVLRFQKMKAEFIHAYQLLKEIQKNDENLKNFIPEYHLLYGTADKKLSDMENSSNTHSGSVYVWMKTEEKRRSFDMYLQESWKQPEYLAENKITSMISAFIYIAECIKKMHSAGLLHMDIDPSNFFTDYSPNFEINICGISMSDVNAVYALGNRHLSSYGKKGYTAPEVKIYLPDNRADIYSLGSMLFYSIINSDNKKNRILYRPEFYDSLPVMLKSSVLINSLEINSGTEFNNCLYKILKNSLAVQPQKRYLCCEDMIKDLKTALFYLKNPFKMQP